MNTPKIEISCTPYNKGKLEATNQNLLQDFQQHLQEVVNAYGEAGFNTDTLSSAGLEVMLQNPTAFLIDASNQHRMQGILITSYANVRHKADEVRQKFRIYQQQLNDAQIKLSVNGSVRTILLRFGNS